MFKRLLKRALALVCGVKPPPSQDDIYEKATQLAKQLETTNQRRKPGQRGTRAHKGGTSRPNKGSNSYQDYSGGDSDTSTSNDTGSNNDS